jgi:pseudouridine-5'-phosphate glycosidase
LDLPRTVEALETLCVPVYGLETDDFPAFYRRETGLAVDERFEDVSSLAAAIRLHFALSTGTGIVVANPVPSDAEMPHELYETALAQALTEAGLAAVRGRNVTPFLLERLRQLTAGASVVCNRALLAHNAHVAARLAVALTLEDAQSCPVS